MTLFQLAAKVHTTAMQLGQSRAMDRQNLVTEKQMYTTYSPSSGIKCCMCIIHKKKSQQIADGCCIHTNATTISYKMHLKRVLLKFQLYFNAQTGEETEK